MAPLPSSTPIIITTTETPKVLSAISDRTDKFFKSVSSIASQHPFVKSLLFFRSQFDSFFQVHFKIPRVPRSNFLSTQNFAAILPSDSVAGLVVSNGINNFLNLYNTILVVRLVLTWFPNTPPAIVSPLSTICDPYLNIFRGIIPPLGGTLDLSPILAFLVLNALTSSAAALPAELPPSQHLTTTQQKWMRRLSSKSSSTN